MLSSITLSLDTLDRFHTCYPAHYGPLVCRLYPPGDCLRDGNLVAHIIGTYTGDYEGIPRYLGQTLGHSLQSISGGCFHVQVALALVSCSSVGWRNCCSY
jgi:hypothetical protein